MVWSYLAGLPYVRNNCFFDLVINQFNRSWRQFNLLSNLIFFFFL